MTPSGACRSTTTAASSSSWSWKGPRPGLSWETILKKRDTFRAAFDQFDLRAVARYDGRKAQALLRNPGIIRNRLKIQAAIADARAALAVQQEFGSLDAYLWQFVGGRPRLNRWRWLREIPACTAASEAMSRDLIRRGFRFVGPTICYAFMQAVGIVNDHTVDCFRYAEIKRLAG